MQPKKKYALFFIHAYAIAHAPKCFASEKCVYQIKKLTFGFFQAKGEKKPFGEKSQTLGMKRHFHA